MSAATDTDAQAIRAMRGEDARAVLELHAAAVQQLAAGSYSQAILDAWAALPVDDELVTFFRSNPDEETRIVAERGGRIVGFAALVAGAGELRACYVHPDAARGGVGRGLVRKLEEIARAAGLKKLWLDASLNAEPFYRALGFRSLGRGSHQLHHSGRDIPMPCVKMEIGLSTMPPVDDIFDDDTLAGLYDLFNPWMACDDFYLNQALAMGGRVLDLGCGTGMLACRIAAEGLAVTGADPAAGMLRIARARTGGERVTWIRSTGQSLRLAERFDFIYMTGHAFQALLSDDDALAVLETAARHLRPGGRFVFETRNPADQAWLRWTRDQPRAVAQNPEHGRLEDCNEAVYDSATGVAALTHRYRFLDHGRELTGHSRLRFIDRAHLAGLIGRAGLRPLQWYGDWDASPYAATSREIIAVTGLPD